MRTIKFRGKSSLKGFHPWVYGFLFINDDEQTFIFSSVDDNAINQCPVYEETIGQFTGLTDKNGKEIYEGDIVRWGLGFTGSYDTECWHRYAVVKINPDIQFSIIKYVDGETMEEKPSDNFIFHYAKFIYSDTSKYLEIIGNIHDNPNFLTQ